MNGTTAASRFARAWALAPLVWREWRHRPWRHAVALLAVSLGVALAWSVHLINRSALGEFAAAVRGANGEPDLVLRGQRQGFDDALFARALADEAVAHAGAVVEVETYARAAEGAPRQPVRVLGIDALRVLPLAPALMPLPARGETAQVFLDDGVVFVNRAAREQGPAGAAAPTLQLQAGARWLTLRVAGDVAAGGAPLVVLDIAAAQRAFGLEHRISRLDLRLTPGSDAEVLLARLGLPPGVRAVAPGAAEQRVSDLSRAYRVNLTVLALVALFVGAFLVYSVVALSVAERTAALALLGVLGMTAPGGRRALVLAECTLVGVAGGVLGVAAGTGLAVLALHALAGDLGGGYFPGVRPPLLWSTPTALGFAALGVASAVAGGLLPAAAAMRIAPAQALKGLGEARRAAPPAWPAPALLALGTALAFVPPVAGLPLAAYLAVAALLCGGVAWVPAVVHALTAAGAPAAAVSPTTSIASITSVPPPAALAPSTPTEPSPPPAPALTLPPAGTRGAGRAASPLALLAWRRAAFHRATASAATAGVVTSLALSVALTVMVASFRTAVADWLDEVLPADLYARSVAAAAMAEAARLPPGLEDRARQVSGVQRLAASRVRSLELEAGRPPVTLMARPLFTHFANTGRGAAGDAPALALTGAPTPPHGTLPDVFVSEAVQALYGARPGTRMTLPLATAQNAAPVAAQSSAAQPDAGNGGLIVHVRGVYRDFARQFGSIAIDRTLYQRLTGDGRVTDLALWLEPGADPAAVMAALRALLPDPALLDFATTGELRALSLRIFDRSFAVTYYLQAVAIAIGLIGVAASLAAQVLARRKEFGLLAHLGFTRRQLLVLVSTEAAAWLAAGVAVGLVLGLAVSAVLVHVVNPQSFHWTMAMVLPAGRLAALCLAVLVAGTLTAAFAARGATARSAVLSVKEDW